jgi:hypothetical protein
MKRKVNSILERNLAYVVLFLMNRDPNNEDNILLLLGFLELHYPKEENHFSETEVNEVCQWIEKTM